MKLDLLRLFRGFVRNYGTLFLGPKDSYTTFTQREIGFWMKLGEMMGYHTRQERGRKIRGKTRKADLLWFQDMSKEPFLHLESENWDWEGCLKNRLDPTIPYLVLLTQAEDLPEKKIQDACEKLVRRSSNINELLVAFCSGENDDSDLPFTGLRINSNLDFDKVQAYLRKTSTGFYYGVLEEEEEMEWRCDYCGEEFTTLKRAEYHEISCEKRPK